ncbi:29625_t:CDS:2, partial [Gigaspora margarita]
FFKIEISGNLNSNIEVEYRSVDLNLNIKVEYRNIDLNSNIKVEYGSVDINSIIKIEYDNSDGLSDEEYNELLDLYKGQLFKITEEVYTTIETFANLHGLEFKNGILKKMQIIVIKFRECFYIDMLRNCLLKKTHETEVFGSSFKNNYHISIYTNAHNSHTLDSTSTRFIPKNQRLTDKMLKEIEYYTLIKKPNATGEISSTAHLLSIIAKKSLQKKRTYAETIGIVRKAINIAIEKNNSCVLKFLKEYIVQNDYSLVENIVSASSSITNPVKKTRRGCLPKLAHYQLALESQKSKSQKKGPKSAYNVSIICEFCSGNGHRKELHNNNSIETNELDQVTSNESEWKSSSNLEFDA